MNKEGLSHIEVILGFVIFMMSVFFLLASYEPLFKEKLDERTSIQSLYDEFLENTSIEVKEYYVMIYDHAPNNLNVTLYENLEGYEIVAIDLDEKEYVIGKEMDRMQGTICIQGLNARKGLVTVRVIKGISPQYSEGVMCEDIEETYNVTTMNKEKRISAINIYEFNRSYYEGLSILKGNLGLKPKDEFNYNITFGDKSYTGKEKPESLRSDVHSLLRSIKIINASGMKENAEVSFKIW